MNQKVFPLKKRMLGFTVSMTLALIFAGCNAGTEGGAADGNASPEEESAKMMKITQVTNWFAQPEHGGQYTALAKGYYKEEGIDMTIEPGGPQVSSMQIVASGKAQFGMGQADEVLTARDSGIPIVAIAAVFQKSPQAMLFHADADIADFEDLNGRNVYTAPGSGYWDFIKKKYSLNEVKDLAYTGQFVNFIEDKNAVTQSYITSEPFTLKQQGVETRYLLTYDAGFQPYSNVLFTTEDFLKEYPDVVKGYLAASVKGWNYYKDNYEEMNEVLKEKNPDLTLEGMKYGAEQEMQLIFTEETDVNGMGSMTEERWTKLQNDMYDLGLLKNKEDITGAFTTEYLPAAK
ncbi:ABC transporter substrate-binding protein [Paenibacillus sp. Marseille-Q4541]|uniref:ABC transporter substrate-binding protein n=1 Tax=Paenibacillus sp. Marseille-Q4541 TaxID=2831522 RepID=UPI001BA93C52|nr:ABC transporter substrate-binding protein [Paenibacillus sp. Marseille-Q4541]